MIYTIFGGFCMALADSVPGVSGGTIAFILGFYDNFIGSLHTLFHGNLAEKKTAIMFLLKIGAGWIVGFLLAISLLADLFTTGIYEISSLFLGFVIAAIPLVISEEKDAIKGKYSCLVFSVIGAAVLVLLTRMNFSSMVSDLGLSPFTAIYTIIAGALAISAMVLPGISGSTLLMSFGLYVPALATIKQMMSGDFHNVWLILLLLAGVIVGVFLSLGGIKKMLEQHRSAAMYAILGMMVASLYAIVMGPMTLEDPKPAMSVETFHVVWFIAGCAAVLGINLFKHWIDRKERKAE